MTRAKLRTPQWLAVLLMLTANLHTVTSIMLLGGEFNTTIDVTSELQLAMDAAEMRATADLAGKKKIYLEGNHSMMIDESGNTVPRSLASLSLKSIDTMTQDPLYNLFRSEFLDLGTTVEGESLGQFDDFPVEEYANTVVLDLFDLNKDDNIQVEAALIMNVWMAVAHEFWEILNACKRGDDQTTADMTASLDRAAALWIGEGQELGSNDKGNLLYNLAEVAGARFGQENSATGVVRVNTIMVDMMKTIKLFIDEERCLEGIDAAYRQVRNVVQSIYGYMSVPLVQGLIHNIEQESATNRADFVELYALSILPRIAYCDPAAYDVLVTIMVKGNLQPNMKAKAIESLQSSYSCLRVSCSMVGSYQNGQTPQCEDNPETPKMLAGYQPTKTVFETSYIDRDIRQIEIFLNARAYDAAFDYYMYGHNSMIIGDGLALNGILTLHELATNPDREEDVDDQFPIFSNFFASPDYAHNFIMDALEQENRFANASPEQVTEVVVDTMRYMVTYMAALQKLHAAVEECETQSDDARSWDDGAALLIGSMEGEDAGGSEDGYGQLLFGAAKEFCGFFGTCADDVNARVNNVLIDQLTLGQTQFAQQECENLSSLVYDEIVPALAVSLVQGTLHYAVVNDELEIGTTQASLGAGFVFSRSILPLLDDVDETSSAVIGEQMDFGLSEKPVKDGYDEVFAAFVSAVDNGFEVDCAAVGTHVDITDGSICPGGSTAALGLAFGRYIFTTDVEDLAMIALDVKDMRFAQANEATTIYEDGKNSELEDVDGQTYPLTLAEFSTDSEEYMTQDPTFNIYRYALSSDFLFDGNGTGSYEDFSNYADDVVSRALDIEDVNLAAESAVVLNVWMTIASYLHEAVRGCNFGDNDSTPIDSAVALWIGSEQPEGVAEGGWLLYAIAQKAALHFGQTEGEAPVNTALIALFKDAQTMANSCVNDGEYYTGLRHIVSLILTKMTVPLLQQLIYHIVEGEGNYVELYAVAVVPQAAACNPQVYVDLKESLIDTVFDRADVDADVFKNLKIMMDCLRITCNDLRLPVKPDYSQALENLCEAEDSGYKSIAGYDPGTDVDEFLRLDLDILQIGILQKTKAYDAALDYYINGYNSRVSETEYRSLQGIAMDDNREKVPRQFELFKDYFNSKYYADDFLLDAFNATYEFEGASTDQLAEITVELLKGMVSYMAVLQYLYVAVEDCRDNKGTKQGAGVKSWDAGVALYVGSIEGEQRGGNIGGGGQLLYGLAKDMCPEFLTCEGSGDAAINERLIDAFSNGKSLLDQDQCESALALITNNVLSILPVPIIQGSLHAAVGNDNLDGGTPDSNLATGDILTRSILPLIKDSDLASFETIRKNMVDDAPVPDGSGAVFDAYAVAIPGMGVDCNDVGTLGSLGVCGANSGTNSSRPHPGTSTNLGDGLYTTTTYVQDRANIALDVKAIENALTFGNTDQARLIYIEGENSHIYNENGIKVGQRSLSSFSTFASQGMSKDPEFNFVRYGLQDNDGEYLGKDVGLYADTIVLEAFQNTNPDSLTLASEAAVVLNLWMFAVHELYQTLSNCKSKVIADADGVHSIDEVVAYWIGDGQQTGGTDGHLLYALAEKHGELFGLKDGGQSRTNSNILRLFNQAKLELTFSNACTDNPNTFPRLLQIVYKIISQMVIPLIQGLIHYLHQDDKDRIKLYAQAFVPLLTGCNPETHSFLHDKLIASAAFDVREVDAYIEAIESTYTCFNLQCDDIGTYVSGENKACVDASDLTPLAGYKPENDVRPYAKLDLDVLQISILMGFGAHETAEELYRYGRHAILQPSETLSLYMLATTSERTLVPEFESFVRYYDNDDRYADTIVRQGLDPSKVPDLSLEQRREIAVKGIQYIVVYMAVLASMHRAVDTCESTAAGEDSRAYDEWEGAAALLIGSLEGTEYGGTNHGLMWFGLATKRCTQFGTCVEANTAEVNEELITLLYAGRAEIAARGCSALEKTVSEIKSLLLVPMIQSNLRYALLNQNLNVFSQGGDGNVAEGYVFSRSVLPLVEDSNSESAIIIDENLDLEMEQANADEVFNAFAAAYEGMGVDCKLVGSTDGINACDGASSSGGLSSGAIAGIVVAVLATVFGIGAFVYVRRHKKPLNKDVSFVTNDTGVLDHSNDMITGGAGAAEEASFVVKGVKAPDASMFIKNPNGVLSHDSEVIDADITVMDEDNNEEETSSLEETKDIV